MNHKLEGLVFGLIISVLLLIHTIEGQSQESNLPQIIKAMLGDDVVLPCHIKASEDPSQITIEWGRPDLKPRFVYVWHNQKEYLTDQNTAYIGRASLFHDKLNDGDVSLKLSNVTHSDNGKYRCYNLKDKTEYLVQLLVGSVSSPGISLAGLDTSSGRVILDCSCAGWYPEPEVIWLHGEGNIISAGPPETITDSDGVYNVSSRVTVEKRHNNYFTCRLQQKDINQTKETHIHIPDDFFIVQSDCSVSIGFSVVFALMLVFGVFFFIRMKQQRKKSE
uniref:Ig-like domain-containing protein n=1 Tax=Cyprinodon variegatus TaxID=28743 RepID=A0A3Q2D7L5_CYPVA